MNQKPRKRYTPEFKSQAIELLGTGKSVPQVAEDLCISSSLLYRWKQDAHGTQLGSEGTRAVGEGAVGEGAAADELRAVRRENARLKQENDILKKAAIILGTKTPLNFGQ